MSNRDFRVGNCVQARRRYWLVEGIDAQSDLPASISLTCLDDDAVGSQQHIIPSCEFDLVNVDDQIWQSLGLNSPTDPEGYSAYLQSLQWNTSTAADNTLFQAPFRAGIEISPYQLVPLAKALDLPRVNLLIADDVGLGKTIEAGLVLRELMLRKRVDFFVVAAPASMTQQWQEELSSKFGLSAVIVNAEFFADMRSKRGFGYNPWQSGNAFILSHSLLSEETYSVGLKAVLGEPRPRSMLILDEAHHAAPAHSQAYAIDSKMTGAVRDIAKMFEHRVFMSATPHNGHSNSFAALLEMLDPQRFTRGIPVQQGEADAIMVRRLKSDLRDLTDTPFPSRNVENIVINASPSEAPEIALFEDLLELGDKSSQLGGFAFALLQQRLLSSVFAFSTTLEGELAKISDPEAKEQASALHLRARRLAFQGDAKSKQLTVWIKENMGASGSWNERKLIIFSQFEDTIHWLKKQLFQDLDIDAGSGIIETYTGNTHPAERERLKSRFNKEPSDDNPLRILLCTDAAREGINLQHRCADLFHFDLPWNPARLEQRNGRIDRRLQPRSIVNCYYFTYANRSADRILEALVRKTERINRELGEVGPVIETAVKDRFKNGIIKRDIAKFISDLESPEFLELERQKDELRITPARDARLKSLKEELRQVERRLSRSAERKGVSPSSLQQVFLNALSRLNAPTNPEDIEQISGIDTIRLPVEASGFQSADWTPVFDAMRVRPRDQGESLSEYRSNAPLKRVSFETVVVDGRHVTDVEHLHLEHRLVRRLLAQFQSQGFRSRLERTAVLKADVERERAVLLTRLTLYAKGANRLHSEIIPVAASVNRDSVTPLKVEGETAAAVFRDLQVSILKSSQADESTLKAFQSRAAADALALRPIAEELARIKEQGLRGDLQKIGEQQAASIVTLLVEQRDRIKKKLSDDDAPIQLELKLEEERAQYQLDRKNWERRLLELNAEIEAEPSRVRAAHEVTARRLEPVGLVYLLPEKSA